MYRPLDSDLMIGGLRKFRARRSAIRGDILPGGLQDVMMTNVTELRRSVPDFDPDLADLYSDRELMLLAEKILLSDPKDSHEYPAWLNSSQLAMRGKREIFVGSGTPDPAIVSGLYWRTHPEGRGVRTLAEREKNAGTFYKDGKGLMEYGDGRLADKEERERAALRSNPTKRAAMKAALIDVSG
jgi:hypothetical protein